jgi:hypothetical protein
MGWIPHKTEVLEDLTIWLKGAMSVVEGVHHSAFLKPEIEHLTFLSMNPTCMPASVDLHSHAEFKAHTHIILTSSQEHPD